MRQLVPKSSPAQPRCTGRGIPEGRALLVSVTVSTVQPKRTVKSLLQCGSPDAVDTAIAAYKPTVNHGRPVASSNFILIHYSTFTQASASFGICNS